MVPLINGSSGRCTFFPPPVDGAFNGGSPTALNSALLSSGENVATAASFSPFDDIAANAACISFSDIPENGPPPGKYEVFIAAARY